MGKHQPEGRQPLWVDADWWRSLLPGSSQGDDQPTASAQPPDDAAVEVPDGPAPGPRPPAPPASPAPAPDTARPGSTGSGEPPAALPPEAQQPVVVPPEEPPAVEEPPPAPDEEPPSAPPPPAPAPAEPAPPSVPPASPDPVRARSAAPPSVPVPPASSAPPPAPPRRGVREVVGPRVADAGLLLLALAVVLLVYLALAG